MFDVEIPTLQADSQQIASREDIWMKTVLFNGAYVKRC
jgi:hypothetical protein